jgi:hypothetical protein
MKELYNRICPGCKTELFYTIKGNRDRAEKNNIVCRDCEKEIRSIKYTGVGNPFYGKQHTKEVKNKLKCSTKKFFSIKKNIEKWKNQATILKGSDNLMYGKTDYYWWEKKYGKEEADKREIKRKKKISIASSGKNNPMYGKPSPQGSGNGWSGWYNGWYFRSLHELSYMIKVIERFKLKWETGEQKKYLIPYTDWEGKKRNYFCDFIIDGKYLVECKPKKLHGSVAVQSKVKGALNFCGSKLKYKLISPKILTSDEIMKLYKDGKIKFLKRYEDRFRQRYIK